jgi:hypothetical protein
MSEVRYATFDPEGFAVGGGLLDDADVLVKSARFQHFTYPSGEVTTALMAILEDAESKVHEQVYSVGDPEKFAPSEDGSKVLLTGTANSINAKSNFAQFVKSLIDSGVPRTLFQTDNIGVLDGLRIHVVGVAQKDKDGKVIKNAKGFDRTLLLASKLIALPGEKPAAAPKTAAPKATKAATGAPATASAPAAPAAGPVSQEIADKAVQYIAQVAVKQGGSVPRAKVSALVFQAAMVAKDTDKASLPKLAFDPDFLAANSGRPVEAAGGEGYYSFEYDAASQVIKDASQIAAAA